MRDLAPPVAYSGHLVRDEETIRARHYLPHALLTTVVVAVLPVALVWGLRADGLVSSPWLCLAITVALSLTASVSGHWYWQRRPGSGDVLFSELLLWGWLRRVRVERQLDQATRALGLSVGGEDPLGAMGGEPAARRLELLNQLAAAMEAHDPYVEGHSRRVARHATVVARKLGLAPEEVARITSAASVHDVGKLLLPREVLMKPGALTDEEFEIIKRHSSEGAQMVACLEDPELTAIVRHHHERLDGSGYPAGLAGEEIPRGARIIAVADTFDAITSARPYRAAARHKQAIDILEREAGTQLDPAAVRAFVHYYSGTRFLALWSVLAAVPQRAFAWAHRAGPVPQAASITQTAASTVATVAIGAAAVLPPVAFLPWHRTGTPRVALSTTQLVARAAAPGAGAATASPQTGPAGALSKQLAALKGGRSGSLRHASRRAAVAPVLVSSPVPLTVPAPAAIAPGPAAISAPAPAAAPVAEAPARTPVPSGTGGTSGGTFTPPPGGSAKAPLTPATGPTPSAPGGGSTATTAGGDQGAPPAGGTGAPPPVVSPGAGTGAPPPSVPPPPVPPLTVPPPPVLPPGPTSTSQCLADAWHQWSFTNQAACVDFVLHPPVASGSGVYTPSSSSPPGP